MNLGEGSGNIRKKERTCAKAWVSEIGFPSLEFSRLCLIDKAKSTTLPAVVLNGGNI